MHVAVAEQYVRECESAVAVNWLRCDSVKNIEAY